MKLKIIEKEENITLNVDSSEDYSFVVLNNSKLTININKDNIETNIKIVYAVNKQNIDTVLTVNINNSNIKAHINMYSLVNSWNIKAVWELVVNENIWKIDSSLKQENIFIWSWNWKVSLTPKLKVKSNDVNVSHSAKIDTISKDKMFFLQSKWLDYKSAYKLIVNSYLNKVLTDCDNIEETRQYILSYLWID